MDLIPEASTYSISQSRNALFFFPSFLLRKCPIHLTSVLVSQFVFSSSFFVFNLSFSLEEKEDMLYGLATSFKVPLSFLNTYDSNTFPKFYV